MSFASNGDQADGYLAVPASGSGPGVLVLQEWWGLVPQLKRVPTASRPRASSRSRPTCTTATSREHDEMDRPRTS